MRTAALVTLLLAACGQSPDETEARAGDRVECALAGAAAFERVCVVERMTGPDGLILTVRAPDGGFRRLLATRDGRGVIAADGADPAVVKVLDRSLIEVAIGGDRYRLPATVK